MNDLRYVSQPPPMPMANGNGVVGMMPVSSPAHLEFRMTDLILLRL
jgi:hypothetical protein